MVPVLRRGLAKIYSLKLAAYSNHTSFIEYERQSDTSRVQWPCNLFHFSLSQTRHIWVRLRFLSTLWPIYASPPPPYISFLYTDQLGEIPLQKLAAQMQCRCLHWPVSTAHCEICSEHNPVSRWSSDSIGAHPCWPCLACPGLERRPRPQRLEIPRPCMVHTDT